VMENVHTPLLMYCCDFTSHVEDISSTWDAHFRWKAATEQRWLCLASRLACLQAIYQASSCAWLIDNTVARQPCSLASFAAPVAFQRTVFGASCESLPAAKPKAASGRSPRSHRPGIAVALLDA
jgi:hypothetical protein